LHFIFCSSLPDAIWMALVFFYHCTVIHTYNLPKGGIYATQPKIVFVFINQIRNLVKNMPHILCLGSGHGTGIRYGTIHFCITYWGRQGTLWNLVNYLFTILNFGWYRYGSNIGTVHPFEVCQPIQNTRIFSPVSKYSR
jgi:hypothetical protein